MGEFKMNRWHRDHGLEARMFLTMLMLAGVYLLFLYALWIFGGVDTYSLIFIAVIMLFLQFFFSDKLALWGVGGRIVNEHEAPQLHQMISKLCTISNLPKPKVAIVNSNVPNAFATGRSSSNAVVAVTTSLMQRLNPNEVEAVLAHEMSHVKNRDMLVITIASFLSTAAFFIVRNMLFFGMGGRDRNRSAGAAIVVWLISLLVWILSFLLIRALSRYREFAADRGSAMLTGRPRDLISALLNISGTMRYVPSRDLKEVEGMNAFFIIPALSADSIMRLFSTHPPIEERIHALEEMERGR